jgi:hypothetical protein
MIKLFFIFLSFLSLNAEFKTGIFLENLQSLQKIYISYQNAHGNKKRISVNMHNKAVADELIIFDENKRQASLMEVGLQIPDKIISIEIEYIDKNDKHMSKFMGIALDAREIKGDNLYIYQDTKDISNINNKKSNFANLFKKTTQNVKLKNPNFMKKVKKRNMKLSNILKVTTFEKEKYIDILIKNCGNKSANICDEVRYKIVGENKKAVFLFNIKRKSIKKLEISPNIKRIETAYDTKRKPPTHLVIELEKSISKIEKIYYKNKEFIISRPSGFQVNNQQLAYRMYFK